MTTPKRSIELIPKVETDRLALEALEAQKAAMPENENWRLGELERRVNDNEKAILELQLASAKLETRISVGVAVLMTIAPVIYAIVQKFMH